METLTLILAAALAVSEALSLIPQVRANGIFQTIWHLLKVMGGRATPTNQ